MVRSRTPNGGGPGTIPGQDLAPTCCNQEFVSGKQDPACHNYDLVQPDTWINIKKQKQKTFMVELNPGSWFLDMSLPSPRVPAC